MRTRYFIILSIIFTLAFIAANLLPLYPPQVVPENAVLGKEVWHSRNCVSCHTLLGNGGYRGGDLTYIVKKDGRDKLIEYLINPSPMWPHKKRKHPTVNEKDAGRLADYFEYLSTLPTLGWPPEPRIKQGNDESAAISVQDF